MKKKQHKHTEKPRTEIMERAAFYALYRYSNWIDRVRFCPSLLWPCVCAIVTFVQSDYVDKLRMRSLNDGFVWSFNFHLRDVTRSRASKSSQSAEMRTRHQSVSETWAAASPFRTRTSHPRSQNFHDCIVYELTCDLQHPTSASDGCCWGFLRTYGRPVSYTHLTLPTKRIV